MARTIVQKVTFKNTSPKVLYDLYMDEKKHSQVTGAPAKISGKEGAKYSVHNGYISGKNLRLVRNQEIVQTWRAQSWDKTDPDSTFLIHLEPKGKDTILHATHANVPDKHADSVKKGWYAHYWNRWKQLLSGKPLEKYPEM